MPHPFSFHANLETGNKDTFDSEFDPGNRLDYPGPQEFIRDEESVFPHRGAYCGRVNLGKNSLDAYLEKIIGLGADSTNHTRYQFRISDDIQLGDGDVVDLMVVRSASADEGAVCLTRIEPAGMVLGVRDASGPVTDYLRAQPGDWICIEVQIDIDAGAANDGSLIVRIGEDQIRLSNLDQAPGTAIRWGAINQVGDFSGHIYYDEFFIDESRLFPDYSANNLQLDNETMVFFKSGWAFVGSGEVLGCVLIDGGFSNCTLSVYDTAELGFSVDTLKERLRTISGNPPIQQSQSIGDPLFKVQRGCYVELLGTNPSALIRLGQVHELDLAADDDDDDDDLA